MAATVKTCSRWISEECFAFWEFRCEIHWLKNTKWRQYPKKIIFHQLLLLFQLNAHNILYIYIYIYIYHQLPPTCFGVCYAIFRESIVLLAQRLYVFTTLLHVLCCTILYVPFYSIYNAVTMFRTICSSFCCIIKA